MIDQEPPSSGSSQPLRVTPSEPSEQTPWSEGASPAKRDLGDVASNLTKVLERLKEKKHRQQENQ